MKTRSKMSKRIAALLLTSAVSLTGVGGALVASADVFGPNDGKFYVEMDTMDEALDAAASHAEQVAKEGNVLLKNNAAALPLETTQEKVSIFGISSDAMLMSGSGTVTLADAMEREGFKVNPKLKKFYSGDSTKDRKGEISKFTRDVESSYETYNDVAIIVWSAGAKGEGFSEGLLKVDGEYQEAGDWHKSPAKELDAEGNPTGKTLKHENQMYEAEKDLLEYVKAQGFKKIVYVVSSIVPLEMYDLQNDNAVDSILWVGAPGKDSNLGTAAILSGRVNPSGKTVDTWYKDFTADPTWYNSSTGKQHNGYNVGIKNAAGEVDTATFYDEYGNPTSNLDAGGTGSYQFVDYEEDVYLGYRYYETAAYEHNQGRYTTFDYEDAVVYPFGYGLSYTDFGYSDISVVADNGTALTGSLDSGLFASSVGNPATIKSAKVKVTVTNEGLFEGKETVEIYATAPYTGKLEKPHVKLLGYAKTKLLKPGESQEVEVEINMQDIASYDATGAVVNGQTGYVLEGGEYIISALSNSHAWDVSAIGNEYDRATQNFTISGDAYLKLDDYTGNEISNKFSKENGWYYASHANDGDQAISEGSMSTMKRNDFANTFASAPTEEDMTMTMQTIVALRYWRLYDANAEKAWIDGDDYNFSGKKAVVDGEGKVTYEECTWTAEVGEDGNVYVDIDGDGTLEAGELIANKETDRPWYSAVDDERMTGWTQSATDDVESELKVADLAGIDPYGTTPLESDNPLIDGKTGAQVYDEFLNTFSWDELNKFVAIDQKKDYPEKGLYKLAGSDNTHNYGGTYEFGAVSNLAATFNNNLFEERGNIIGNIALLKGNNTWWSPGAQVHRTYFAGRNAEYASEDPILSGYLCAYEIKGAQHMGVNCMVKHAILYDQEAIRRGHLGMSFVSEQAFREIYAKPFELSFQVGGASAVMATFSRVGRVSSSACYNFIQGMIHEEWGCKYVSATTDMYRSLSASGNEDLFVMGGMDNLETSNKVLEGYWDASLRGGKGGVTIVSGEYPEFDKTATYKAGDIVRKTETREEPGMKGTTTVTVISYYKFKVNHEPGEFNAEEVESYYGTQYDAQWYYVRLAAMKYIFVHANTAMNHNGIYFNDWTVETQNIQQGGALNADFAAPIEAETIEYAITSGTLPAGLTLSADGKISGTPTESGSFEVTITCTADTIYSASRTLKFEIAPAFAADGETSVAVGDDAEIIINAVEDSALADAEFKVSVAEGTLPEGLVLDELGFITGAATTPGTYNLVLKIDVLDGDTVSASYEMPLTLTVTGEAVHSHGGIVSIEKTGTEGSVDTYTITYEDGDTSTFTITNGTDGATPTIEISDDNYWVINGTKTDVKAIGQDGANGADGTDGTNGTTPTIEISDDNYWVINGTKTDVFAAGTNGASVGVAIALGAVGCALAVAAAVGTIFVIRKKKGN